jgi:hypothetical protein
MIGIISENDVLQAYLDISEEINQIEKHWINKISKHLQ